jgi:hypothetical protein
MGIIPAQGQGLARSEAIDQEKLIFILGLARSGTSWLGKIFDSHPDVLYRHEPDIALRDLNIPAYCEPAVIPQHLDAMRSYVERLLDVRTVKTSGSLPIFRKHYHGRVASPIRLGYALGLRAMEQLRPFASLASRIPVPDLVDHRHRPSIRYVIKSVSALGRAGLLAAALPRSRFVLILRHPCGEVASRLRAHSLGLAGKTGAMNHPWLGTISTRYGMTEARFHRLPLLEQYAWEWSILNEIALDQLPYGPRLKLIRYEDLCTETLCEAQDLMEFAGLGWDPQTERFIRDSTAFSGRDRYYQVFKNSQAAMTRWRSELDPAKQRVIREISWHTRVGKLFWDSQA